MINSAINIVGADIASHRSVFVIGIDPCTFQQFILVRSDVGNGITGLQAHEELRNAYPLIGSIWYLDAIRLVTHELSTFPLLG